MSLCILLFFFFFFKQKTAYDMRISDWSSDVCSSDLLRQLELVDHLLVLDLHVEALLVPVDQLLDRRRQILVGGDDGNQRADVEAAGDREQAAAGVEHEGRQLGQQVVDELHEELALIDLEADVEDAPQPRREIGALVVGGVVRLHFDAAIDDLTDASRELACRKLPFTAELQDAAAQARDQVGLEQHHRAHV